MTESSPDGAKRVMDLALGGALLVLTLPVQAVVATLVRLRLGSPVLFRQERAGLHGQPFILTKFRTMLPVDTQRGIVDDADRLTPLGRALRSASLDELPTLWNVVRGDMSLVGPRPLPTAYLSRYSPEQSRRHDVRPGVTGLAQVSGRNALTWDQKFRLDADYVNHHPLHRDLLILLRTVVQVVTRRGIAAPGSATMPVFTGSEEAQDA